MSVERIRLLNGIEQGNVFKEAGLICLRWNHKVGVGKPTTIGALAKELNTSSVALAKLNGLAEDAVIKAGDELQAPAIYRSQAFDDGRRKMSLFMVAVSQNPVRRRVLDFQRIEMVQIQIAKGDTLEQLAKKHEIDIEILGKINGLTKDSKLKEEQIVVVRNRVKYDAEKTPLDLVAQRYNSTEASMLRLNDIKDKSKIKADQWLHIPSANYVRQMNARAEQRRKSKTLPANAAGF